MSKPWLRRLGVRLALMAMGLLISLAIFEGFLRVLSPDLAGTFHGFYEASAEIGYKMKPGLDVWYSNPEYAHRIRSNSLGFRDTEHEESKLPGTSRVLVLGDSFVEALQVTLEQTFHRLLEKGLNQQGDGQRFEVIAMGVGGFGLSNEYMAWHHYGKAFDPDWVILVAGSMNDIGCMDVEYPVDTEQLQQRVQATSDKLRVPAVSKVYRSFRTYTLVRNQLWRLPGGNSVFNGVRDMLFSVFNMEVAKPSAPHPWLTYAANGELSASGMQCWEEGYEFIAGLGRSVRAEGGELLVVMRPRVEQIVPGRLDREFRFWQLNPEPSKINPDRADDFASEALDSLGIHNLLLYSYMREASPNPESLYFEFDRHWTPAGHRIAADAILARLLSLADQASE